MHTVPRTPFAGPQSAVIPRQPPALSAALARAGTTPPAATPIPATPKVPAAFLPQVPAALQRKALVNGVNARLAVQPTPKSVPVNVPAAFRPQSQARTVQRQAAPTVSPTIARPATSAPVIAPGPASTNTLGGPQDAAWPRAGSASAASPSPATGPKENILQLSSNKHNQNKYGKQSNKTQVRFQKYQQQQQPPVKKPSARMRRRAANAAAERTPASTSRTPNWGPLQWLVFYLALSALIMPTGATPTARRSRYPTLSGGDGPLGGIGANTTSVEHFRNTEMRQLEMHLQDLRSQLPSCPTMMHMDGVQDQMEQLYQVTPSEYLNKAVCRVNPSQGRGHVVVMVGLPGSGKSTKQHECTSLGYVEYDDIGRDWKELHKVRTKAASGTNIVMSDIMFTNERIRREKEAEVQHSQPFNYIYFTNDPEQCKLNAQHRKRTNCPDRDLGLEFGLIDRLSRDYDPPSNAYPVFVAPKLDNDGPK